MIAKIYWFLEHRKRTLVFARQRFKLVVDRFESDAYIYIVVDHFEE